MTLNQIRLELRGPIEQSPFAHRAGVKSREKIAYCKRQIALLTKWQRETGCPDFAFFAIEWSNKVVDIQASDL